MDADVNISISASYLIQLKTKLHFTYFMYWSISNCTEFVLDILVNGLTVGLLTPTIKFDKLLQN